MRVALQPKRINPALEIRLKLKAAGYDVIPYYGFRKNFKGWPHMPNAEEDIRRWGGAGASIRMKGSGVCCIDIDVADEALNEAVLCMLEARWPAFMERCVMRHS